MNMKEWFAQKSEELGGVEGFSGGDPNDPTKPNDPPIPVSSEEISRIEKALKVSLPEDYRRFLLEVGGCSFVASEVGIRPIQIRESFGDREVVAYLYGCEKENGYCLLEEIETYKGRVPATLIPIGDNGFGDLFCIGIKKDEYGKVYFWDHENERDERDFRKLLGRWLPVPKAWLFGNITLVAISFEDFLNRLEKVGE